MSRNAWIFLIVLILAGGWSLGVSFISAKVLADMAGRPIVALVNGDGLRVAAQVPGGARVPGEAHIVGAKTRTFGFDNAYLLPDGSAVICRFRFSGATCDNGWTPERKAL